MTSRRNFALLFAGALVLTATAVPAAASPAVSPVVPGQLTVCMSFPYKPFQFIKDGKQVGFDVDLTAAIAKDLGLKQVILDLPFDSIQAGQPLASKVCDLAASGMTITDGRKEVMDFSDPYFAVNQALLARKDSSVKGFDSVAGKSVGVQSGTTGESLAKEKAVGATLVSFETVESMQMAVLAKEIDAAINDNVVMFDFAQENKDVAVVAEIATNEQYGMGVRKGNSDLLAQANATLAAMRKDGRYAAMYRTWLGTSPVIH